MTLEAFVLQLAGQKQKQRSMQGETISVYFVVQVRLSWGPLF